MRWQSRKEVKFVVFQQAAVQQLVGRRTVVSELHTGFHAKGVE